MDDDVTLLLCGDVMLGRGVDQILPHPGDPTLRERSVQDARTYVALAAQVNGSIPSPVDWSWPWGDALELFTDTDCHARIVNLETSITTSSDFAPGKAVHYRMHPANLPALRIVRPDVCMLANNHVLDSAAVACSRLWMSWWPRGSGWPGRAGLQTRWRRPLSYRFHEPEAGWSSSPSVRRPAASRMTGLPPPGTGRGFTFSHH